MHKMILVLSQKNEKSTDDVLLYMRYLSIDFIRINEDDLIRQVEIKFIDNQFDISFLLENRRIHLSDISGYWYRRGKFNFRFNDVIIDELLLEEFIQYRQYFDREFEHVKALIHEHLRQIPHINSFEDNFLSKLNQLYWAKNVGLKIPDTLITHNKQSLKDFFTSSANGVVIKTIRSSSFKKVKENSIEHSVANHIKPVTENKIDSSCEHFLPTKFQKYTDKKFEIRSFYLNGDFYSMAIFSQENEKTKLDFRNYDYENPNRNVPFKLPDDIENKLRKMMNKLNLNSGSMDLIYTHSMDYVFLEVNPIGQFDWLSKGCNYDLPYIIAKEFKKEKEILMRTP